MGQSYQFKFYNPHVMLAREQVTQVLRGFAANGAKTVDYVLSYKYCRVLPGTRFEASHVVLPDGTALVGLSVPAPGGPIDVIFQTYPREAKGAQVTLSVGEDVFEENPTAITSLLLELAKTINLHLPACFGWGDHELTLQRLEPALRFDRVSALAWANLFGPEMVRRISQERLLALPAYQRQAFKQGVLCLLSPVPGMPLSAEQIAETMKQWPDCVLPGT